MAIIAQLVKLCLAALLSCAMVAQPAAGQASPSGVDLSSLTAAQKYGLLRKTVLRDTGWHDGGFTTCFDSTQNGDETAVDCGGSCATCVTTCSDTTQNGDETGVDCGGSCDAC